MILFNPLPAAVTDSAGLPIVGARLFFYQAETTTLATVWQDANGDDEHANPVVADSSGRFAAIFVPAGTYDVVLTDASEDTGDPIWRADGYDASEGLGDLIGTSGEKLGYLDADKTDTGDNTFEGSNTFAGPTTFDEAVTLPVGSTAGGAAIGYIGSPANLQNGNYTLVSADQGKTITHTSAATHAWTIPPNSSVAFDVGTQIGLYNGNAGGNITVTQGVGVTLRRIGAGSTGNRTLAANGMAVLTKVATDEWTIVGVNIT